MSEPSYLIVTAEQCKDGHLVFHPNMVPNVTRHAYEIMVGPREDGSYVVRDPSPPPHADVAPPMPQSPSAQPASLGGANR